MLDLLKALLGALTPSLRSHHELAVENLALRKQNGHCSREPSGQEGHPQ